jgi:murein DD-endopeptidase MepM/ murein hydrolase activator NlpD
MKIIRNILLLLLIIALTIAFSYFTARQIFAFKKYKIYEKNEIERAYLEIDLDEIIQNSPKDLSELKIQEGEASVTYKVAKGDVFNGILLNLDFKREEVAKLSEIINKEHVGLSVGQGVFIKYLENYEYQPVSEDATVLPIRHRVKPDFTIQSISFKSQIDEIFIITKTAGGFAYKREKIALKKHIKQKLVKISNSIFIDGMQKGISAGILMDFINLYAYDIDFQRDIQDGEEYRIFYEEFSDNNGVKIKDGDILYAKLRGIEYYRFKASNELDYEYFDKNGRSAKKSLLKTPINGAVISSKFGTRRHPILGYSKFHAGIDFAAPMRTPVFAAGNGTVVYKGVHGGHGNYVKIKHNETFQTAYAHLSGFAKGIGVGSRVKQGQIVAYVGSTGRSTGPHLHFEVIKNNSFIDPHKFKGVSAQSLSKLDKKRFEDTVRQIHKLIKI